MSYLRELSREGQIMRITRRHLAVTGALALGGLGLLQSSSAVAESADEAAVAQAIEALRKAILACNLPQVEKLDS